ncbi:hypothetical protein C8R47DRAFT_1066969 [Mycena vitilis]|nr:hypothetical protein C8R47DRAFT_1066969 [Mycena vitilis]
MEKNTQRQVYSPKYRGAMSASPRRGGVRVVQRGCCEKKAKISSAGSDLAANLPSSILLLGGSLSSSQLTCGDALFLLKEEVSVSKEFRVRKTCPMRAGHSAMGDERGPLAPFQINVVRVEQSRVKKMGDDLGITKSITKKVVEGAHHIVLAVESKCVLEKTKTRIFMGLEIGRRYGGVLVK